jgi:hypothetical protein
MIALYNTVVREIPSGALNGTNVTYTLANTPALGMEMLFLNGLLQAITADYSISGNTITMVIAPLATDKLVTTYFY